MGAWWWQRGQTGGKESPEDRFRAKYASFRQLLTNNNDCLELMADLQEDLRYVAPFAEEFSKRISAIFEKTRATVEALETLSGRHRKKLRTALDSQQHEVESYLAEHREFDSPRLSMWLSEIDMGHADEVGGKAAALGEIRNKLELPVPDGFVITTGAYRRFCGERNWRAIRDAVRDLDSDDLSLLKEASRRLTRLVMESPVPRALEVAITERGRAMGAAERGMAVRSSAMGEGGKLTFAGQFLSLLNIPEGLLVGAYKRVVAGRFGESAMAYRLTTGVLEVETPMAVLFQPVLRAAAAGILYTRDPNHTKESQLLITATRGLGIEIASGRMPADQFIVTRDRSHIVLERRIATKESEVGLRPDGGLVQKALHADESRKASLDPENLHILASWGLRIEEHFGSPQDIEWVLDEDGSLWIVQSRPLALTEHDSERGKGDVQGDPLIREGQVVYPGRVSGAAHLAEDGQALGQTPRGAVLVVRQSVPEMIPVFPRIVGLVAEQGNITGHSATLLREFKVPSLFQAAGAFDRIHQGDPISLDATHGRIYPGLLWEPPARDVALEERYQEKPGNPISRRLITLNLLDPGSLRFRPGGCKSAHDVLRFCHEKAIEAMFEVGDNQMAMGLKKSRKLITPVPVNLQVMDLGNGLVEEVGENPEITPEQVVSRPFQSLWRGITHPGVPWSRKMPADLSDLATVMFGTLSRPAERDRPLGDRSYLLVAKEYMNLNSRLGYHFTLLDACLSDIPNQNYISFRFAGGAATRWRRNLRACFIEACLKHYGYQADRRGDVVNAWLRKTAPEVTEEKLEILGRLVACTGQLDMYMASMETMRWYVSQFIAGNYRFMLEDEKQACGEDS